jgi:hypothetical protein
MARQSKIGVVRALFFGLMIVVRRPSLVVLVWLVSMSFALVGGVAIESELREAMGHSRLLDGMRGAVDLGLMEELVAESDGLISTIQPVRLSSAAVFDNFERWISGDWASDHRGLVAWGILFVLAWVFLQGGVVEHLIERRRQLQLKVFFAASGEYFGRFLRLSILTGAGYYCVYRIGKRLFPWIERMAVDVTEERLEMTSYLAGALTVMVLLSLVHLVSDYAKIALVMHRRRSSSLAAVSALFQVLANPLQTFGLFALSASLLLVLQLFYLWVSPGPEWRSLAVLFIAFLIGQLYLMGRWTLRLARYAAEIQLVESWTRVAGRGRRET